MQCCGMAQKRNTDQITLRLAGTLRAELEAQAAAESRGLSSLVRTILIAHTIQRHDDRAAGTRKTP
jgi:hypothetical protein